ncbi:MarR family winged helix-turn-helix transcriptional regulator [Paraeggerthella hominis]|uniref:MarR family winged helix-turn-helix transcriptional regulator n=1 Tax=Paraeggerthella hominis TaxID=2897351 RepID=UPI001E378121|nr:MarR family transcriptional regulator [Paraeggerthella hominis]MCD2432692.1 MarR family transcriptional regulator [Paraeggerthella hominis]
MANEHNQLIGFKVYDAQRSIYKSLETALAPLGITPGQFNLLNQLDRAGELSQKALAERTRKEQATITRYLDLLERKGLVVRTRDKNDRRAHAVSITDEARALLKAAEPITFDRAKRLVEGVDQEDLDTFGLPIVGFSRVRLHRLDPIPILDYIFNPPFQGRAHEPVSKRPARLSR